MAAQDSHAVSVDLLVRVLNGGAVATAARVHGLSASAADQRIKRLARHLQATVGVERVAEHTAPNPRQMRAHRAEYLEALQHYDPARPGGEAIATEGDLHLALERIALSSRQPERDAALILLLFGTGLQPAELMRLEVRDYLGADGRIRLVSSVRAELASDGRCRPLYFTNPRATAAVDRYLGLRSRSATSRPFCPYRGLVASSPLLLARPEPAPTPFTARTFYDTLRRILRFTGKPGLSTRSVRRYVANRLMALGADEGEIRRTLGLRNRASLKELLIRTEIGAAVRKLV